MRGQSWLIDIVFVEDDQVLILGRLRDLVKFAARLVGFDQGLHFLEFVQHLRHVSRLRMVLGDEDDHSCSLSIARSTD
jgi:hypothetical protein